MATLALVPAGAAETKAEEPKHLAAARLLLKEVHPEDSSYQHKDSSVRWKDDDGASKAECHTDCSGFLDALLKHSYGYTQADLKKWFGDKRPKAHDYYDTIAKENGFAKIANLKNVRPGDIIAIKYPPGGENTGHILLVNSAPEARKATKPLVEKTEQWEVSVIDCSRSGHGKTDTRHKDDGKFRDGLGQGVFRLYTDHTGDVVGYSWSVLGASEYVDQASHALAIGRVDASFKP